MRLPLVVAIIVVLFVSGSPAGNDSRIESGIKSVENGLVVLASPSLTEQFQTEHIKTDNKSTLFERMSFYGVPGVGIAVIDDYQVLWAKGYGAVEAGTETPVTAETCFEAASSTKLLTSVLTLHLVEKGRLNLDEDVNTYLKSWKIPENEFTREKKVTLRRLLTHRGGINRPDGGFSEEEGSVPTFLQVLKGEKPALNAAAVVEYVPGSKHQYSNFGYLIVQLVLEDVSGKPYRQIVHEKVFEPLGMKCSTLTHPLAGKFKENLALPHDPEGKAHDRPQHPTALAHGGLVTTPSDWALFASELARAYQGRSSLLLSQKTARQMFEISDELDPAEFFGMNGGLGVFLVGGGQSLYFTHPGQNAPGTTCVLIASPATGKGAVIMTNGAAGLQLSLEILPALVNAYGWPVID